MLGIGPLGFWLRSKYATSVLCSPPGFLSLLIDFSSVRLLALMMLGFELGVPRMQMENQTTLPSPLKLREAIASV